MLTKTRRAECPAMLNWCLTGVADSRRPWPELTAAQAADIASLPAGVRKRPIGGGSYSVRNERGRGTLLKDASCGPYAGPAHSVHGPFDILSAGEALWAPLSAKRSRFRGLFITPHAARGLGG